MTQGRKDLLYDFPQNPSFASWRLRAFALDLLKPQRKDAETQGRKGLVYGFSKILSLRLCVYSFSKPQRKDAKTHNLDESTQ
jgi:hypothetical protein